MDKTIIVPNEVFFSQLVELLNEGKTVTFTVKGHSMYPFMRDGKDSVCVGRYDAGDSAGPVRPGMLRRELKRGDVILFLYKGRYILHRIVAVRKGSDGRPAYITKGDGNLKGGESATAASIVGVMLSRITPAGRSWSCSSLSWRLLSALWLLLSPLRRYFIAILHRLYK